MNERHHHHLFDDEPSDPEDVDTPTLGPCCMCETTEGVRNILMLPLRGIVKGHGWGCFECGLPCDGAVAVLCDGCFAIYQTDASALRFACRGYPASDGRVLISVLPQRPFDHDNSKHREDAP
jgi:hypothetical protein